MRKRKNNISEAVQVLPIVLGALGAAASMAVSVGLDAAGGETSKYGQGHGNDASPANMEEKKIGFNKGAEYDEEAADEFDDFAVEVGQLYQIMKNKSFKSSNDDEQEDINAISQQILVLIDDDTDGDLRSQFEELGTLIKSLPDKPTEKKKIGFRQAVKEIYNI